MQNFLFKRKVCFVSSRSGFVNGERALSVDWANGRLIYELSKAYGDNFSLAIFSDTIQNSNYNFLISDIRIYPLPFPFSYVGGAKNYFTINRILKEIEKENDILIIQLPFIGFPALLNLKKPIVFHVCANVLTAARNPFKYKGASRLLSMSYANLIHKVNRSLFKRNQNRIIVNGSELAELYRAFRPIATVSSSIYSSEMIMEEAINTRLGNEDFAMLFIGRPSKEKGFHTLIDGFIHLVDIGKPVSLKLLGVKREELESILGRRVDEKYLIRISFLGFISWGDQFRAIIQSSHCLVVSSVSEGTPRVLIEARALGCPVVATNIGGIVTSVTDQIDGILINPAKPMEISMAIVTLFDEVFRIKLAKNGLSTAKKHTMEMFVKDFTNAVQELTLL